MKIRKPPEALAKRPPKASSHALSQWDTHEPLTLQVVRGGGAECWWEIRARGRVWRRPGHLCIEDVFQEIFAGTGGKAPTPRTATPPPLKQRRRSR